MPEQQPKRSRTGTNVRRRQHLVGVRLLPEEFAKLREMARQASLSERVNVSEAEILRRAVTTS